MVPGLFGFGANDLPIHLAVRTVDTGPAGAGISTHLDAAAVDADIVALTRAQAQECVVGRLLRH